MTNVVLILVDDLGYSDLGCYGSEIATPNIDRLASEGVRMTRFYNTARCSPSRASLLSGRHPHQTGIGILTNDDSPRGYPGNLRSDVKLMPEYLRERGFTTAMAGKWHLAADVQNPNAAWPTRRGFESFFGTLTGCGSYFDPGTLTRGEENAEDEAHRDDFHYTDAITDEAVNRIAELAGGDNPFFTYVAYTAPHWPLHASEERIAAYEDSYADGWDATRERRFERQCELGIADESWELSPRHPDAPAWESEENPRWQQRRMAAYAAMVTQLDEGVGRIRAELERQGVLDDTMMIFLSDNGASAEELPFIELDRFLARTDIVRTHTRDGEPVAVGNDTAIDPGPEDTYCSYGLGWANVSNTPFRLFKQWTHEGGIAAPFVVRWPAGGVPAGEIVRTPRQLTHVLPTILDAVGQGTMPPELESSSMLDSLRGEPEVDTAPLFWEHIGNAAMRTAEWKLVRMWGCGWELYDTYDDPCELVDLADRHPEVVAELSAQWQDWADRVGVIDFAVTRDIYADRGLGYRDAIG
ncbi:arylsulfatase [Nocardioidaceae bacterium SCSIO 66511]|nr:arylsulfatase [Nocardioidaceae bacterium SCSIO 66511]